MGLFNRKDRASYKPNVNKMTPEELQNYVNNLPEKQKYSWKSVVFLGLFSVVCLFGGIALMVSNGFASTNLALLLFGVLGLGGTAYLIYKIMRQ